MDALLGAMEPTIYRLSILPSVTARRKPHGGIFQGSSMYFFCVQLVKIFFPCPICPPLRLFGSIYQVCQLWAYKDKPQCCSNFNSEHRGLKCNLIST